MRATIRLVLLTAFRDRLFAGLLLLLGLSIALSMFLGRAAVTEQIQMAIVFAAGAGRIVLVLGLTIFAAFHIQGLIETREVEAILARDISRPQFVLAYWLGLACLSVVLVAAFSLFVGPFVGVTPGIFLWAATILAECLVVLAVAVFAGLMLERATPTVFFTLGFYALARLMGFFAGIRDTATDLSFLTYVVKWSFDAILLFVPRLDLFAQTRWIIYGIETFDARFVILQSGLFLALVLVAASFDLKRKQF